MSCCSHVPLIDPWGQTQYPSWLNVIEFVSYLQEFCRHQRTNQILPVGGGVCRRLSDMRRLPSSWAWPLSEWIIWKRKTPKTWQWPTASRNEPDSWTTLYSTCPLSLSSSLIPSYPLRFWDVLFSTNLSAILHPVWWWPAWEARRPTLSLWPGWLGSFPPCQHDPSTCRQPFFYMLTVNRSRL